MNYISGESVIICLIAVSLISYVVGVNIIRQPRNCTEVFGVILLLISGFILGYMYCAVT